MNDVFYALNGGKVMNNMNISNLEYALDKIRQVKDGILKNQWTEQNICSYVIVKMIYWALWTLLI